MCPGFGDAPDAGAPELGAGARVAVDQPLWVGYASAAEFEQAVQRHTVRIRTALRSAGEGQELVFGDGELTPLNLLAAYRAGCFPMGLGENGAGPFGWWSPDPRGVVWDCRAHISRSLRRQLKQFTVTVDQCFDRVIAGCGAPDREGRWITAEVMAAYQRLHRHGVAHSIEVWDARGQLAGGLYGVAQGGLFAGESKFHTVSGASKVAVVAAAEVTRQAGAHAILDVQWNTGHLESLGVVDVTRAAYLEAVEVSSSGPAAPWGDVAAGGPWRLVWAEGAVALEPADPRVLSAPLE